MNKDGNDSIFPACQKQPNGLELHEMNYIQLQGSDPIQSYGSVG